MFIFPPFGYDIESNMKKVIVYPEKILVLVRHAHRDTSLGREKNNGLSKKGKKQAKLLCKYFEDFHFKDLKPLFVSSPSKRCVETLEPLAKSYGLAIQNQAWLWEGGNLEEKVLRFTKWWIEKAPPLVVASSHGDLIPLFLSRSVGSMLDLEKGGFAELHLFGHEIKLVNVVQKLFLKTHRVVIP